MAGRKDVVVRAQALDGVWDVLGATAARGVFPEDVVLEADAWGPSRASFNLRRNPARPWPDLGAFTPVEIDVGGMLVWDGRVQETPSQIAERVINVQCEGWQYHLDDDVYERPYVHTDLTTWKDLRSFLGADLTKAYQAGTVANDNGTIVLGMPNGAAIPVTGFVGVQLDFGSGSGATPGRFVLDWEVSNNNSNVFIVVRISNTDEPFAAGGGNNILSFNNIPGASTGTTPGTPPVAGRYVSIFLFNNAGATLTPGADVWLKVKGARVFADAAHESSNQSILKASDVVSDALAKGTMLLSSDRTGIQATNFNIPTFAPGEPLTPRQAWERVDAYHDWVKQIAVGRRPVYKPKPSAPVIEVGVWSAATDEDASANSGEDIYNRALITGQTPDGQAIRVKRANVGDFSDLAPAQLANPSFDVNTTGWTALLTGATITRDTGVFDSSPASGRFFSDSTGVGQAAAQTSSWAIPVEIGTTYQVVARVRREAAATGFGLQIDAYLNDNHGIADLPAGQFATYKSPAFTAEIGTPTSPNLIFFFLGPGSTILGYIDSIVVFITKPTLPDRRGFRRTKILPISNAIPPNTILANPPTSAVVIANTWLGGHKTTPFKGSSTLVGNGAARDILTGEDIPPERLLLKTMELVRFSDRSDPDTGGHGRDGRIVGVSYTAATDTAQVTIDNSRASFEALMARLDLLAG